MNNNGSFERLYSSSSGSGGSSSSSSRMRQTTAAASERASLGRHRLALIEPFSARRSTGRNEIRARSADERRRRSECYSTDTWKRWVAVCI